MNKKNNPLSKDDHDEEFETIRETQSVKKPTALEWMKNSLTNSIYRFQGLSLGFSKSANPLTDDIVILGHNYSSSKQAQQKIKEIVWVTYRSNFPRLLKQQLSSDTGWGCMIRAGQMLMAQALQTHQNKHYPAEDISNILTSLLDDDQSKSTEMNYSIQKIVKIGSEEFKLKPGSWLTPSHIAYILQQLHSTSPLRGYENMKILVFNNNTLFFDQIISAMGYPLCTCTRPYIQCPVCHVQPIQAKNKVFLILLTRVGLEKPNPDYREIVTELLSSRLTVGMIGGKPNKALYFIGREGQQNLIYLDPHFVQPSVSRKNLEELKSSFSCRSYRTISYGNIDPSIGFGFYFENLKDVSSFQKQISKMAMTLGENFFLYSEVKTPEYVRFQLEQELKDVEKNKQRIADIFSKDQRENSGSSSSFSL